MGGYHIHGGITKERNKELLLGLWYNPHRDFMNIEMHLEYYLILAKHLRDMVWIFACYKVFPPKSPSDAIETGV